jgi:hypothetical protein
VMYMMRRMPISSSMETLAMLMQTAHSPTHQSLDSKAGNSIVMRKAGDIARNWRNLLASNPSVAAQWGNQQTE